MDFVETKSQVDANAKTLWASLRSKERALEALKIIKNGSHYVATASGGKVLFTPSRFAGYIANNIARHGNNLHRHGTKTTDAISRIYKCRPAENSDLESRFLQLCNEAGVEAANKARRYWWDDRIDAALASSQTPKGPPPTIVLPGGEVVYVTVAQRRNHDKFRTALMRYWGGRCVVTGCSVRGLLQAAHIKPWKACTPSEKTNIFNGLILLPTVHALFDQALLSFDSRGSILLSPRLSDEDCEKLGISRDVKIPIEGKHAFFLKHHLSRFTERCSSQRRGR